MRVENIKQLFEYTHWAHDKLWACVMQLSDADFDAPCNYSVGSVHDQIVHMIGAEWVWLQRALGQPTDGFQVSSQYPTRADVKTEWERVQQAWKAYLGTLTDGMLAKEVVYSDLAGTHEHRTPLWMMLMQVVNHGTDHRAQTLALLHRLEVKTDPQDWIFFVREARQRKG